VATLGAAALDGLPGRLRAALLDACALRCALRRAALDTLLRAEPACRIP